MNGDDDKPDEIEYEIAATEDGTEYSVRIICSKPVTHEDFAQLLIELGQDILSGQLEVPVGVSSVAFH